ncbi:uncharacterized protein [Miscanthus floridulus]|uniref:uncharacterized protein n=1 Tax=Miscanthus floridulus TaxID=154761 RepID=UPI003459D1FF
MADVLGDLGETVSDRTLVLNIIHGLNEKFAAVGRDIRRSRPLPSFLEARDYLLLEELTMASPASTLSTALLTGVNTGSSSSCPSASPHQSTGRSSSGGGKGGGSFGGNPSKQKRDKGRRGGQSRQGGSSSSKASGAQAPTPGAA